MDDLIFVKHACGAPGLRYLGLGPKLKPLRGIKKLKKLFNENTSWAKKRSTESIKKMLSKSEVLVSAWRKNHLVGFGRAVSDETYRTVLWDIVVEKNYQGLGLGKRIVNMIINDPKIYKSEKIYVMTTHCENFYKNIGFNNEDNQSLMIYQQNK